MNLYNIHVDGSEFSYDCYSNFTVIAETEQAAIDIVYNFTRKDGEVLDYIKNKLIVKYVGSMSLVEDEYVNNVVSYNYIQA